MNPQKNLHLWKNKSGTYYFRQRLPECLRIKLGKTEVKISLKTDSYKEARKFASIYAAEIHLLVMGDKKAPTSLQGILFNIFPEAKKLSDTAADLPESLLPQSIQQILGIADDQIPAEVGLLTSSPEALPEPTVEPQAAPQELLSDVFIAYFREMELTKRWKSDRGPMQVKEAFGLFVEMVGDKPIRSISKQLAREYKQKYMQLPANRSKKKMYRDKAVSELLAMDIPEQDLLEAETVKNNLTRLSTFFKWAVDNDYLDKNPFSGLLPGKSVKKDRDVFNADDLKKLFDSKQYQDGFKLSYQYWCPLIALYSGMRCEEIARLRIGSIVQDNGIWIFDGQKGDDGWTGKYGSGLRRIPIHQKLLNLGLLRFVSSIKANGGDRLFPDLKPFEGKDEYGVRLSRWFAVYRKDCGVDAGTGKAKTFHSFRHTLINALKQAGTPEQIAQAIAGHDGASITYSHYGKGVSLIQMQAALNAIDFGLNHPPFNFASK